MAFKREDARKPEFPGTYYEKEARPDVWWENQEAIDAHHASLEMKTIADLRDKYDLHMRVERFVSEDLPAVDEGFIRK